MVGETTEEEGVGVAVGGEEVIVNFKSFKWIHVSIMNFSSEVTWKSDHLEKG